ncbi:NF-kappa-B-activating protein-like [Senna tora]|uniref:NF-kappa-B-activating protein-like n=1 Tax=Senna tora TaxID=362788 RepID=A0A834SJU3_9FABA|nr:NF-kappa-B-activating protein-like [Senna tora]
MGRPASTIEIPDGRRRLDKGNGRYTPDSDVSDDYRSRRSPSYESYGGYTHRDRYRRRSESPEYRSPRNKHGTLNDDALPRKFGRGDRRQNGAYLDRDRGNGGRPDSESDEELKGLSYEEYRRLKRQKMRKMLKRCIWNVTPSPPRYENDDLEDKAEEISDKYGDDGVGKSDSGDKETKQKGESGSGSEKSGASESESSSESSSESDVSRSRKKRRGSGSRRRKRRTKSVKSRKSSSTRKRSRRKRKYSDSDESEDIENDRVRSRKKQKRSSGSRSKRSRRKRQSRTKSESSYSEESSGAEADAKNKADEAKKAEINAEALKLKELFESQKKPALDDEPPVGPVPLPRAEGHISYGGALRPGEGDAIAHAEDKRALAMFNYEEKAKREHKVMADLQRLVQRHIGQDVGPTHDPFGAKALDGADA